MFEFTAGDRRMAKWNGLDQVGSPYQRQLPKAKILQDTNLWYETGDCHIFLDDHNNKRRATPSFRIPLAKLRTTNSTYLLDRCRAPRRTASPTSSASDSGYESSNGPKTLRELHISTPRSLSGSYALDYRISVRNYFAILMDRPLVGARLGSSLFGVRSRLQEWQNDTEDEQLLAYCRRHKYLSIMNNPRHATAILDFAENARLRGLWIHAFAHCVAMYDRLDIDSEYAALSNTTKALITRGSLEMELHITRAIRGLSNFLEEELSNEKLGLSKPARDHLDHFRSFLQAFYLDKLGYFPPVACNDDSFNKQLWSDMRTDFADLYDYLVDSESKNDMLSDNGVTGGVCVFQNLQALNERHNFEPLSHPLPLLPDMSATRRTTESSLRNFKLIRVESDFRPSIRQALSNAANNDDPALLERPIVQDYIRFESQKLEEKISVVEARKVRWLLIYAMLQTLSALVGAPAEVIDANSASYALCINTKNFPAWHTAAPTVQSPVEKRHMGFLLPTTDEDEEAADRISIHPDCEADNAHEFFQMDRRGSTVERSDEEPDSPRPQLSRSASIRSSVHTSMTSLHRSMIGLSRRNSIRKAPSLIVKKMPSSGNIAIDNVIEDSSSDSPKRVDSTVDFDFGLTIDTSVADEPQSDIPLVEEHQLTPSDPEWPELGFIDEPMSPLSDASRRSSACMSDYDTASTEPSSRSNSTRESKIGMLAPLDEEHTLLTSTSQTIKPGMLASASATSLNVGVYTPSGMNSFEPPVSKFAAQQRRQVYERRGENDGGLPMSGLSLHDGRWRAGQQNLRRGERTALRYTYSDMP